MPSLGEIISKVSATKKAKRKHIWAACEVCGKERWVQLGKSIKRCSKCRRVGRLHSDSTKAKLSKLQRGDRHPAWKGGVYRDKRTGYIYRFIEPDNFFFDMTLNKKYGYGRYVLEHRLIMAEHLGRCLHSWESVHHKNGVKDDNHLDNLELLTKNQHSKDHCRGYRDGFTKGYADGLGKARKEMGK